jgi:putative intracellular protease/amidase
MNFKVLMVLTSHNALGDTGSAAGSWLEELAAPYYVLGDAGCKVDFASVRGGGAPIDPVSVTDPWLTDSGKRLLDDGAATRKLLTAPALSQVDASAYDAVFLVGGAAVMWDFPHDETVGKVLGETLRSGRVAGGVCHGVGGFLNPGVVSQIAKRRMTCISDQEDALAGFDKIVPMMPESPLRKAGATLTFAAEPFGCNAVRDGNLVTGQNPASAGKCGALILEALRERSPQHAAAA